MIMEVETIETADFGYIWLYGCRLKSVTTTPLSWQLWQLQYKQTSAFCTRLLVSQFVRSCIAGCLCFIVLERSIEQSEKCGCYVADRGLL